MTLFFGSVLSPNQPRHRFDDVRNMNKTNMHSMAKPQKPNAKNIAIGSLISCALFGVSVGASAQSIEQIRWKGEEQVRKILGEPQNKRGPVGTHASYTMWDYGDYTVAFANKKAFHMFRKNSLKKVDLNENR